jgi:hypothetical protein
MPSIAPHRCCFIRDGVACRATPLRDQPFCFWHSPDHTAEAAEARRLGGLRRKRERTVAGAYAIEALDSVLAIRRLVEIATLDALGLENTLARARTLASLALVALRLLDAGELEARLETLEEAVYGQEQPGQHADDRRFVWEEAGS